MAKAYSDDLRRRFLSAYEQGEGTLEELAERFMVSLAYGKKLRGQLLSGVNYSFRSCCLKWKCYRRISRFSAQILEVYRDENLSTVRTFLQDTCPGWRSGAGQWWRPTRQGIANWRLIQTISGAFDPRVGAPSDGKISPCLKKLIFQAAANRHPRCSALSVPDATRRLVSQWFAAHLRKPVAARFAFSKHGLGAARCVAARRGIRRNRWLAIA